MEAEVDILDIQEVDSCQLVERAERAIKDGNTNDAEKLLDRFFKDTQVNTHFIARAYLCKVILNAPSGNGDLNRLADCNKYLNKIVTLCKPIEEYHYIVFNASVISWKLMRPFQVTGYRKHLIPILSLLSRALEDLQHNDESWRLELLISLVHAYLEGDQRENATKTANKALALARQAAPDRIYEILKLQISNGLSEGKTMKEDIKANQQLYLLHRVMKLRSSSSTGNLSNSDIKEKLQKMLDSIVSHSTNDRKSTGSGRKTRPPGAGAPSPITSNEMISPCLVELSELSILHNQFSLAATCMKHFKEDNQESSVVLRAQLLKCQIDLHSTIEDVYNKKAVELRLRVLVRLCDVARSSHRLKLPSLVEVCCVVLWNASLPLLQHNLRHHLTKPLSQAAHYLETVESLQEQLRCHVHYELAKCLEKDEKLSLALEHVNKALRLDSLGIHTAKLKELQHRLILGSELYKMPNNNIDKAQAIVQQMQSSSGITAGARALLVKACSLLAPDGFEQLAASMTSEEGLKREEVKSSDFDSYLAAISQKTSHYKKLKETAIKHREQVGNKNDKIRCRLWLSIAKLARRHEVMAVSCLASYFCLVSYNDGRWGSSSGLKSVSLASRSSGAQSTISQVSVASGSQTKGVPSLQQSSTGNLAQPSKTSLRGKGSQVNMADSSTSNVKQKSQKQLKESSQSSTKQQGDQEPCEGIQATSGVQATNKGDKDMLRILSEVAVLHAEALVFLIKKEDVKLFIMPTPPSAAKYAKDFDLETNEQWNAYCGWLTEMSSDVLQSFLSSAEIALQLKDGLMLHNAAVYMWNYSVHLIDGCREPSLVSHYKLLYRLLRMSTSKRDPSLISHIGATLVKGTIRRWEPRLLEAIHQRPISSSRGKKESTGKGKGKGATGLLSQVDQQAEEDFKEALRVCEECLKDGRQLPLPLKYPLLKSWVQAKQILQQPIDKSLGQSSEEMGLAHKYSVVISIEMLKRHGGDFGEFNYCPTIKEAMEHMSHAKWDDSSVALELWSSLAEIAWIKKETSNAEKCASEALSVGEGAVKGVQKSLAERRGARKGESISLVQCHEMLSMTQLIYGDCLAGKAASDVALMKGAQQAFIKSARHGQEAKSYKRIINSCRMFWNMSQPMLFSQKGCDSLVPHLLELLEIVSLVSSRRRKSLKPPSKTEATAPSGGLVGSKEDLDLRTAMYCTVLRCYTAKCKWSEGLSLVDDAMQVMPRSHHRELVKHRVVFKCKLQKNVEGDLLAFEEEPEEVLAEIWYKVASYSDNNEEIMKAYRKSLHIIKNVENGWLKFQYMVSFGEWLYRTCHSKSTVLAQFQDALQLAMCLDPPVPTGTIEGDGELLEDGEEESDQAAGAQERSNSPPLLDQLVTKSLHDITNVPHLVCVMEMFLRLALTEGEGTDQYKDHILTALDICMIIWKNFLVKLGAPDTNSQNVVSGKDRRSSKLNISTSSSAPLATKDPLPTRPAEWAMFTLSEQMVKSILEGSEDDMINKHTIVNPTQLFCFLQELVKGLQFLSMSTSCLPVLVLQLILSDHIMDHSSLTTLTLSRLSTLCSSLQMEEGVQHCKEKLDGTAIPDPKDVLNSQDEISSYTVHEEATSRELTRRTTQVQFDLTQQKSRPTSDHVTKRNTLHLREVWLEQAKLLVDAGDYNTAQNLLQMVCESAEVFKDVLMTCQVMLAKADIAYREKDYSGGVQLVLAAQSLSNTPSTCLSSYNLLIDLLQAQNLSIAPTVEHGVRLFSEMCRQNSSARFSQHAVLLLQYRMKLSTVVQSGSEEGVFSESFHSSVMDLIRQMDHHGYSQAGVDMATQYIDTIKCELCNVRGPEKRKYLQTKLVELMEFACERLRGIYTSVVDQSKFVTMEGVMLPIVGGYTTMRLDLCELLIEISSEHMEKTRRLEIQQKNKPTIERMVEDFVKQEPNLTDIERKWLEIAKSGTDKALMILSSLHQLTRHSPKRTAKAYLSIGGCLLTVANGNNPSNDVQWNKELYLSESQSLNEDQSYTIHPPTSPEVTVGQAPPQEQTTPLLHHSTLSLVMRAEDAKQDQHAEKACLNYLTQAVQVLAQAVSTGLEHNIIDVVRDASLLMAECIGALDCDTSLQYLALHQSCVSSLEVSQLVQSLHSSPPSSQLAAILRLKNLPGRDERLSIEHQLNEYPIFKAMTISSNHFNIVKNFPSHFRFIILQHSPDWRKLYVGYMLPPQPPAAAAKKKGSTPVAVECTPTSVITSSNVDHSTLDAIADLMQTYCSELKERFLEKEKALRKQRKTQDLKSRSTKEFSMITTEESIQSSTHDSDSVALLTDVLAALEAYLGEALKFIHKAIKRESEGKGLTFVILADNKLLQLPLEGLSIFSEPNVNAVSRDFSLQVLANRLEKYVGDETSDTAKQSSKAPKKDKSGDKSKPQPESFSGNCATVKYFFDVKKELSSYQQNEYGLLPDQLVAEIQVYPKLTAKWNGVVQPKETPSQSNILSLISTSNWILYLGESSFLGLKEISTLKLEDMSLVMLMSSLPSPLVTMETLLLSYTGSTSVLHNQWMLQHGTCVEMFQHMMKSLFSDGKVLSEAYWEMIGNASVSKQVNGHVKDSEQQDGVDLAAAESNIEDLSIVASHSSHKLFNFVLYGLPHVNFTNP